MLETATFLFYSTSLEKELTVIWNLKLFCKMVTNQSAENASTCPSCHSITRNKAINSGSGLKYSGKNLMIRCGTGKSGTKQTPHPLPQFLRVSSRSKSVVNGATNRVKYTAAGKPVQVLLAAPKVLAKTFSLSFGDYSDREIKLSTGKHLRNEHPIRTHFNYSFKIN